MSEITDNFRKEYSKDFTNLDLIPDSLLENSTKGLKEFINLKRKSTSSKIKINIYYERNANGEKVKEDYIEIEGSDNRVDVLTIYDKDAIYELIFEYLIISI